MKNNKHLWQGEWIDDMQLAERMPALEEALLTSLTHEFDLDILLNACGKLYHKIISGELNYLESLPGEPKLDALQVKEALDSVATFAHPANIREKIVRELGSYNAFRLRRHHFDEPIFEAWSPLGVLTHIAPSNALSVAPMAVIEGLMAGNINLLKNSPQNGLFAQYVLKELADLDDTDTLRYAIYAFNLPSQQEETIRQLIQQSDGVSAWGGESAISAVRSMTPAGVRFIEWGHKISFAYFTEKKANDDTLISALAKEVCRNDQQACSSPQCIFVETENKQILLDFSERLKTAMVKASEKYKGLTPSVPEMAEITTVTHLHRAEAAAGNGSVIEGDGFRILVDYRTGLSPSPLYRTLWVKPVKRADIIKILHPLNIYLQTCGLACTQEDLYELTHLLLHAGVVRITPVGQQVGGYVAEPHDSVYALQRFSKRITCRYDDALCRVVDLTNFKAEKKHTHIGVAVTDKEKFLQRRVTENSKICLQSGGSSTGVPKLSYYSWEDWEAHMHAFGEALLTAGMKTTDKVMNLLPAGNLYGGFIGFFEALKHFNVEQFAVSMQVEPRTIAEYIVSLKPNVIMGFPSFIRKLLSENADIIKGNHNMEKIYVAGEYITEQQIQQLKNEFGIKQVTSVLYGSNDALTTACACPYCEPGVFHVVTSVCDVEILKTDSDEPVESGETGRIMISTRPIKDEPLVRYAIGDLGMWIDEPCACGQKTPRLQLKGRYGDLFRPSSGPFLNYRLFSELLKKHFNFDGDFQIIIKNVAGPVGEIIFCLPENMKYNETEILRIFSEEYHSFALYIEENTLNTAFHFLKNNEFERGATSGKIREIIDQRN